MSDPVTNIEIEDVLSSIRRLVSEGEKVKRGTPPAVQDENVQPDRLVLTPALRVKQDESEPSAPTEEPLVLVTLDADPEPKPEPEIDAGEILFDRARLEEGDIPFDRASLEATIAELEAAVTEQPDEWEPDGSEVVADTSLDPSWARAGFASDQPVEDAVEMPEVDEDDPVSLAEVTEDDVQAAQWDKAPLVAAPEPEPETAEAPKVTAETSWTPDAPEAVVQEFAHRAATESVVDALADHIAAVADAPETAPQESAEVDAAMPPLTFRRSVDQDADEDFGDDLRAGEPDAADETLETYLSDDTVVDEAALRQMVLEIVREELQGKLGERITMNVRKLVRREIHRVLTSQDFD